MSYEDLLLVDIIFNYIYIITIVLITGTEMNLQRGKREERTKKSLVRKHACQ